MAADVKKPTVTKKDPSTLTLAKLYASKLEIPLSIAEDIAKNGNVARWINGTQFQREHGFHRSRWQPYRIEKKPGVTASSAYSPDPEGFVRRGDLILAIRSEQEAAQHKAVLDHKANLYKGYEKQKKAELQAHLKEAGIKSKVEAGYGEEDEE